MTTPPNPKGTAGLLAVLIIALSVGCMISNVRNQHAPDWQPGTTPSVSATAR